MRFYDIQISDPASGTQLARFTSYDFVNQATIPGALNIELDIPVAPYFVPDVSAYVSVWGIGLQNIAQARDFNNLAIKVYGGMKKGLPLAKPQQAGLLIAGEIQQAYGNWIGTEQTLDLQIRPSTELRRSEEPRAELEGRDDPGERAAIVARDRLPGVHCQCLGEPPAGHRLRPGRLLSHADRLRAGGEGHQQSGDRRHLSRRRYRADRDDDYGLRRDDAAEAQDDRLRGFDRAADLDRAGDDIDQSRDACRYPGRLDDPAAAVATQFAISIISSISASRTLT